MTALRAFNFDALKSLDRLKSSGIEEGQARAFISLLQESTHSSFENLTSKEDLENTKSELKQDIALTEARLENKITEVKSELKQDIAEVKNELSGIKGTNNLLVKLFSGSVLLIVVNIAITLLHHT